MIDLKPSQASFQSEYSSENAKELKQCISIGDWENVYDALFELNCCEKMFFKDIKCCGSCAARKSLLHHVMKYDPPIEIVEKIVGDFPSEATILDCMNRSPLQVGLLHGLTSPEVVKYLIDMNEIVVKLQDKEGKTLLHLALDGYENILDETNGEITPAYLDAFSEIVNIICYSNPSMVEKTDDFEQLNAVDYALERQVDFKIISKLQKVARNVSRIKLWKI